MEYTREIIEVSSDEDEDSELMKDSEKTRKHPDVEKTREHPNVEKKVNAGGGNDPPAGTLLNVMDNDECLILDGDPQSATIGAELGSELLDEMLIVGEKGQFACRDYPHPRYLCASFLFSITPHKKHCAMCYCYVCDCLAPCGDWEKHCSSTHRDHSWRVERLLFRRRKREEQRAHKLLDVNPTFSFPSRTALKSAPSQLPRKNDNKPSNHHGSNHVLNKGPNQPVPKYAQSILSSNDEPKSPHQHEPIPHARRSRYAESSHISTETAASRPKDILCEIYKICPAVISCRRRIPPSLPPHELSETEQDD